MNILPAPDIIYPTLNPVIQLTPAFRYVPSDGLQHQVTDSRFPLIFPGSHINLSSASLRVNRRPFDLSCRESIVPSPEAVERPVLPPWRTVANVRQCSTRLPSPHLSVHEEPIKSESARSPEDTEIILRRESPVVSSTCSSTDQCSSSAISSVESSSSLICHDQNKSEEEATCESIPSEITMETEDTWEDSLALGSEQPSKKNGKSNVTAMVRRLEPRLPSPSRLDSAGDLYRDPSELTREERALQRAMMRFSEMEMKEKGLAVDGVVKRAKRRKLRNHMKVRSTCTQVWWE